jgi:hypothetical protein
MHRRAIAALYLDAPDAPLSPPAEANAQGFALLAIASRYRGSVTLIRLALAPDYAVSAA